VTGKSLDKLRHSLHDLNQRYYLYRDHWALCKPPGCRTLRLVVIVVAQL